MNAKSTPKNWVSTYFTPTLIIGAVIGGAFYFGEYKTDSESKQFESPAQKEKTRQHINSNYNEVKNYQLGERLLVMEREFDTAFAYLKRDIEISMDLKRVDSVNSVDAVKSRAKRDSLNAIAINDINNIKRDQTIQTNTTQLILQELRSIRKYIDTTN